MKLARLNDGPEIFHTLQGEGTSAGLPAVFIRSSRCNLHCRWCDTDYTWNFEGTPWPHDSDSRPGYAKYRRSDVTIELDPAAIVPLVTLHPARRVVLTGGEPLLQQNDWLELITRLRAIDPDYTFEVETNGTRLPIPAFEAAVDQFNVSPKLANSGMDEQTRIAPEVLARFAASPKAWFKFVVRGGADFTEIDELVRRHALPSDRIIVMPEGRTAAELDTHAPTVAAGCLARGWRFSDRLHVRLWGDRRGV